VPSLEAALFLAGGLFSTSFRSRRLDHSTQEFVPQIREIYQVVPSSGGSAHIRSGDEIILALEGTKAALLGRLLLTIDGKKSVRQIATEMADSASEAEVRRAVDFLRTEGILANKKTARELQALRLPQQTRYLEHHLQDANQAVANLAELKCLVLGAGSLADRISHLLIEHGLQKVDCPTSESFPNECTRNETDNIDQKIASSDIIVCAAQNFAPATSRAANDLAITHRTPVLFVDTSSGEHGIIGPLCVPGQTSCYTCYEARLAANTDLHQERLDYEDFLNKSPDEAGSYGALIAFEYTVSGLVVLELLSYLTGYRAPRTIDGTLIVDFLRSRIYRDPVLKLPNCKSCSQIRGLKAT